MWLFTVVIVLLFFCIHKVTTPSQRIVEFAEKVPGPKRRSIFERKRSSNRKKRSNIETIIGLYNKYGPIFRIWAGNKVSFYLTEPNDIEVFLSSTKYYLEKSFSQTLYNAWIGDKNLLTSKPDVWRIRRKQLTPSFHFKIVEKAVPLMLRNAKILCDKLETETDRSSLCIEEYVEKSTLDIIGEIAMGIKLDTLSSENSDYLNATKLASTLMQHRIQTPMLHSEIIFKLTKSGRDFFKSINAIKKEGRKVIEQRKKLLQENCQVFDYDEETDGRKKLQPFLDFMLTQDQFTDTEIENEVLLFMFAGHDTTKSAMSFCLYCLASHQDVQEKAFNEVRETILNVTGEPTYTDFLSLKYLENVIKESMRLYSPAPFISRKVDHDVMLPSGYLLPSGSYVEMCIFLLHRNEKYFKEPEKFIPERFEERDNERHPYAYIPFSAGPRNCIGQKFAMLEMRIIFAMLLLKYKFCIDEKAEPVTIESLESCITLQCSHKLPIIIKKREMIG